MNKSTFQITGDCKSKINVQTDFTSLEGLFSNSQTSIFSVFSTAERTREPSDVLLQY